MNRDEIMNMQPGRELDSLISEKLMGYVTHGHFREKNGVRILVQPYSTDISAAWEVVEKFPIVNISRVEVFEKFQHHAVEIFADTETNEPSRVEATTAAEAICKAALLSLIQEDTP